MSIKKAALRAIGNLLSGDGGPTKLVLDRGFMDVLPQLLEEEALQKVSLFL
jgi:hypothetical protein